MDISTPASFKMDTGSLEQPALSKPQAAFEESLIAVSLVSVASDKKRKRAPQLNIFALHRPYTQFA